MIPTRSPYTDPAWLSTIHIVPSLEFDPEKEQKRIAERDRQESIAAARGILNGLVLAAAMWAVFIVGCCL